MQHPPAFISTRSLHSTDDKIIAIQPVTNTIRRNARRFFSLPCPHARVQQSETLGLQRIDIACSIVDFACGCDGLCFKFGDHKEPTLLAWSRACPAHVFRPHESFIDERFLATGGISRGHARVSSAPKLHRILYYTERICRRVCS